MYVCVYACVRACTCSSESQPETLSLSDSALLTCSRFPSHTHCIQAVLRLPVRKSLNELAEATGHRQSVRRRRRRRGAGGGRMQREASNPRKRNFLLCKHSFHLPCLLPPSQTGVNTLESPGLSQSSRFLLRFSLPLLSPPFSVALNILSSPVIACPVCIPLSPHLFLLSKCFPSAPS